jgi:hypothetical protein
VLKYLNGTRYLKLKISVEDLGILKWYVDGSHNTHWDCKGHGGAMFTMGKGATSSYLRKVKLNTKSSTETELVVSDMYMPEMLWLLHFIEAQGYDVECIGLYQDNISTQMLIRNGRFSSGRKTKHVKAKFFFIKDRVDEGEIKVIDCPAEEMWADILTKPLQGLAFRTMRAVLMNCLINYEDEEETEVIRSMTNTNNTPVPPKKWENNLKTVFHVPQECVGRNGSNLRKPSRIAMRSGMHLVSTDRQRRANNGRPRICKQ